MLKQTIELDESLIISKELNGLKYFVETSLC